MTGLPAIGAFADLNLNETNFQSDLEALRAILAETPGGNPEQHLTLAADGSITPAANAGCFIEVDTYLSASTFDLNFINVSGSNIRDGHLFFIRSKSSSRTVRAFHNAGGSGRVLNGDSLNVSLTDPRQWICYKYDLTNTCYNEIFHTQNIDLVPIAGVSANQGFFGPTTGGAARPSFRAMVLADLGTLLDDVPGWLPETTLSVTSNHITPTRAAHMINNSAAAQDIRGIIQTNTSNGSWLLLGVTTTSTPFGVTLRHNYSGETNPLLFRDSADVIMTKAGVHYFLMRRVGTSWKETARFGYPKEDAGFKTATALQLLTDAIILPAGCSKTVRVSAQTGSADDMKYVDDSNISDGEQFWLLPAAGHTITARHNASGASGTQNVLKLRCGIDRLLTGDQGLMIFKDGSVLRENGFDDAPVSPSILTRFPCSGGLYGTSTGVSGWGTGTAIGTLGTGGTTTGVDVAPVGDNDGGRYGKFLTSTTSAASNGCFTGGPLSQYVQGIFGFKFRLPLQTAFRFFCGLAINPNSLTQDLPATDNALLRLSTVAGDANFKAIARTGNGVNNYGPIDTGIPAPTAETVYEFAIDTREKNLFRYYLNNLLVAEIAASSNFTTGGLYAICAIQTTASGAKWVGLHGMNCQST